MCWRYNSMNDTHTVSLYRISEYIPELEREVRRLRADSARLDWLEENCPFSIWRGSKANGERIVSVTEMDLDGEENMGEPIQCDSLRAAIDEARKGVTP